MNRRHPLNWQKQTLKLKPHHGWKARPGFKIFVADRGAVRFDIPQSWVIGPYEPDDPGAVTFHDKEPPDDNCRLKVSYLRLNPRVDWRGLSLARLLEEALKADHRDLRSRGQIVSVQRDDLVEYAWTEMTFWDPSEMREARSRACLARGNNIQPFITLDYWPEDASWVIPAWEEVLRSLQLGQYVKDPTHRRMN